MVNSLANLLFARFIITLGIYVLLKESSMKVQQTQSYRPYFGNNTVIVDEGIKALGEDIYYFAESAAKGLKKTGNKLLISIERGYDPGISYDLNNLTKQMEPVICPRLNNNVIVYVEHEAKTWLQKLAKFLGFGRISKSAEVTAKIPNEEGIIAAGYKALSSI